MRATRVGVAVAFLACVVFETWAVMPMVAGTGGGSLVLRNDTTLWQWGFTPGGTYYLPEPVVAAGRSAPIRGVSRVAAGLGHFLASSSYTLYSWGSNHDGRLGDGTNIFREKPVETFPCGFSYSIVGLAAGYDHSLVLCSNGAVKAFGSNTAGQLGTGVTGGSFNSPQTVAGVGGTGQLDSVVGVAAGAVSSYAVRSDGSVVAWGNNASGQLGDASTTARNAPVVVTNIGGTGSLSGVTQVSAVWDFALARRSDGSVVGWGLNSSGQLGIGSTAGPFTSPVQALGVGGIGALSGIRSVVAGAMGTSYAITNGGRLLAWGENVNGTVGDGTSTDRTAPVDIGFAGLGSVSGNFADCGNCDHHALAITSYGRTYSWGYNSTGQLGVGQAYSGFRAQPGLVNSQDPTVPFYAKVGTDAQQPRSDFTGDLVSDVMWTEPSTGSVHFWAMNGVSSFARSVGAASGGWTLAGSGDFDMDGAADLLWRHADGFNYVWFMDGPEVRGHGFIPAAGPEWSVLAVNDFTGEGGADILLRRDGDGALVIWQMAGLSLARVVNAGSLPPATWSLAATGDLDGDGRADLLWRDSAGGFYVWITGLGAFNTNDLSLTDQGALPNPGLEWSVAAMADMDGDGKADILFRRASDGVNYLWRMNGKAIASQAGIGAVGPEWSIALVGDFNGDGRNDLFFRRTDGVNYIWLMNDTTIVDQGTLPAAGTTWSVLKPR